MEIHLYRLDDTAFRLIVLLHGKTLHRSVFEARDYAGAFAQLQAVLVKLNQTGMIEEAQS